MDDAQRVQQQFNALSKAQQRENTFSFESFKAWIGTLRDVVNIAKDVRELFEWARALFAR